MVEWYLLGYIGYICSYGQKKEDKETNVRVDKVDDEKLESVGSSLSATVQKNPRLERDLVFSILFKWLMATHDTIVLKDASVINFYCSPFSHGNSHSLYIGSEESADTRRDSYASSSIHVQGTLATNNRKN